MARSSTSFGSGNPGRPKGAKNKATRAIQEMSRLLIEDKHGWDKMLAQYRAGKLHPSVFQWLCAYAYGKPKDTLKLEGQMPTFRVVKDDGDSTQ